MLTLDMFAAKLLRTAEKLGDEDLERAAKKMLVESFFAEFDKNMDEEEKEGRG